MVDAMLADAAPEDWIEQALPGPSAFVDPERVWVGIENRIATEFAPPTADLVGP
jgi:hypothetical protein